MINKSAEQREIRPEESDCHDSKLFKSILEGILLAYIIH